MKLKKIKTFIVGNPPPYFGGRYWIFVKLITDEGIIGLGECTHGQEGREATKVQILKDMAKRFVIGKDPFMIEALWQDVYTRDHDYRHPGLLTTSALSAIEMACWDIIGKALNQPVYNLLGGRLHDKLTAYSYMSHEGIWENPELAGERALERLEKGHKVVKLDPFQAMLPAPRPLFLKEIDKDNIISKYQTKNKYNYGLKTLISEYRKIEIFKFWESEFIALEIIESKKDPKKFCISDGVKNQGGYVY